MALAPVLKEMCGPAASLFLRAEREFDPIAILYSQPSIQVDWLLESTVDGSTWLRRFSSYESAHNRLMKVRDGWLKAMTDLGYSPRFVSSEQVEQGALTKGNGYLVCVLPDALALSEKEAPLLTAFAKMPGHVLFADGTPGYFDGHGKLRAEGSPFKDLPRVRSSDQAFSMGEAAPSGSSEISGDIASYGAERLAGEPKFAWPQVDGRPAATTSAFRLRAPREPDGRLSLSPRQCAVARLRAECGLPDERRFEAVRRQRDAGKAGRNHCPAQSRRPCL